MFELVAALIEPFFAALETLGVGRPRRQPQVAGGVVEVHAVIGRVGRQECPVVLRPVGTARQAGPRVQLLHVLDLPTQTLVERLLAILGGGRRVDRVQPRPVVAVQADRADHGLTVAVRHQQHAGAVQTDANAGDRLVQLGGGVVPGLFLGLCDSADRVRQALDDVEAGLATVVGQKVGDDATAGHLRVFVGNHLGEAGRGGENDAGVAFQGAEGDAPLGGLVDMASDGSLAVGGLVVLGFLALGSVATRANLDGGAIGVELPQRFGGGQQTGLVEGLLDAVLGVEQGASQREGDLDGDRRFLACDNDGRHRKALSWTVNALFHRIGDRIATSRGGRTLPGRASGRCR